MSANSPEKIKHAEQEAILRRDFDAQRCTILTEYHGDKWRIHGFGPKLKDGKPDLVAIVVEFNSLAEMLVALPGIAAGFYNVINPCNTPEKTDSTNKN
jgi:hypothetical protein